MTKSLEMRANGAMDLENCMTGWVVTPRLCFETGGFINIAKNRLNKQTPCYENINRPTGDMERSVYTGGFPVVADSVASAADDLHIFTLVLVGNSERLPAWPLHL